MAAASSKEEKPPGKQANPQSLMLTPEEAMSEIRVSRATMFKLLRTGANGEPPEIESFKLGRNARRIPRTALEAWMLKKLEQGAADRDEPQAGAA